MVVGAFLTISFLFFHFNIQPPPLKHVRNTSLPPLLSLFSHNISIDQANGLGRSGRNRSRRAHSSSRFLGVCRTDGRAVEVYAVRSEVETMKKLRRRLRRRREKEGKKNVVTDLSGDGDKKAKGQKRGMLDDSDDEEEKKDGDDDKEAAARPSPEEIAASDEFEFRGTARTAHKLRGFAFDPRRERGGGIRVVAALATNALEVHSFPWPSASSKSPSSSTPSISERVSTLDMYGHPTGIRSVALSTDDALACTVSKSVVKVWNVANRSCLHSLDVADIVAEKSRGKKQHYCLCASFLPGNSHVVLGTREGHLLLLDVASGDIVHDEEDAHDGAIWSLDVRHPTPLQDTTSLMTGSADRTVKFWDIESQEDDDGDGSSRHPALVHARSLRTSDDVMCVRYSRVSDPSRRLVFVAGLDSTVKAFFDDSLRFFLNLYGHKLPALAIDAADDSNTSTTVFAEECRGIVDVRLFLPRGIVDARFLTSPWHC